MKTPLQGLDGLFISNPTNIRYLTGFVGVAPNEREVYVLITKHTTYLFTNSLYLESAKKLREITVIEISKEKPIEKELAKRTKSVGFEENDLTVAEFNKLKKVIKTLIPTKNKIEDLRMIKGHDEIENIRQAAKLTDECFSWIIGKLKPGVTEKEITWEIHRFLQDVAFSPIVAFNEHSSQPHYSSQNYPLKANSLVLLDFGARVNGYCADMTRVVFIGKPKKEWIKAYDTVLSAQQKVIDLLANGTRSGAALDAAAKKVIAKAHLPPYRHSLGHAVGLAIHEAPRLTIKKDQTLKPNMVVTVEPGVYIEGQYGIRIEDLVLLKKDSIEVLSHSTKDLIVL